MRLRGARARRVRIRARLLLHSCVFSFLLSLWQDSFCFFLPLSLSRVHASCNRSCTFYVLPYHPLLAPSLLPLPCGLRGRRSLKMLVTPYRGIVAQYPHSWCRRTGLGCRCAGRDLRSLWSRLHQFTTNPVGDSTSIRIPSAVFSFSCVSVMLSVILVLTCAVLQWHCIGLSDPERCWLARILDKTVVEQKQIDCGCVCIYLLTYS